MTGKELTPLVGPSHETALVRAVGTTPQQRGKPRSPGGSDPEVNQFCRQPTEVADDHVGCTASIKPLPSQSFAPRTPGTAKK